MHRHRHRDALSFAVSVSAITAAVSGASHGPRPIATTVRGRAMSAVSPASSSSTTMAASILTRATRSCSRAASRSRATPTPTTLAKKRSGKAAAGSAGAGFLVSRRVRPRRWPRRCEFRRAATGRSRSPRPAKTIRFRSPATPNAGQVVVTEIQPLPNVPAVVD
jgi:hypothetical protein